MKIWIINHYAIPPSMGGLVRHYYFSKYLQKKGHKVQIFTASKIHNTDINMICGKELYKKQKVDGITYTFVRTSDYKGNGMERIVNMLQFPLRMWKVQRYFTKPDIIYTSSPDLFTALSAVLLAKFLRVPKVVEIRDLWPESIVEYNKMSRKNPIIQVLYQLEKWIYKQADELIFTMEGGKDYIKEKGWDKVINLKKVHYVNNGVDLKEFEYNKEHFRVADEDLEDEESFKVVYTGSIRKVNCLETIIETARILEKKKTNIKFLIWGDGNDKFQLENKCKELNLNNICFKGKVDKKYIPYILSKADINLLHGKSTKIMKYGCSPNKLFDYIASGKLIFSDISENFDLVEKYELGVSKKTNSPNEIVKVLTELEELSVEEKNKIQQNSKGCIQKYSYQYLSEKIEKIFIGDIQDYEKRDVR